tara:strand:+ start:15306 stop:16226 length:921 start_codon:yes stop_codon:yes gene_type:complete
MKKKIVFMGTPKFSVPILEVLIKSDYSVECVYTQPPQKSSRGQKIKPSPIELVAKKYKLKIRSPRNLNTEEEYNFLNSMKPFLVIVVAYGKIIPKKFLELSEKGFLNIHASLLPKWRGAAPIQRSILNKDKETGISFMKIEEKLDEGPFMKQIKVKINHQTTSLELSKKLSFLSAKNIIEAIKLIESDKAIFHNQNNDEVSYAYKIKKKEAKIIWSKSALDVISQINGLNPSPGAWFEYENSRFKIWKAEISELSGKPGRVLNDELTIACKDKSIKILEIQKEGKNKLHVNDFLSGNKIIKNKTII